MAVVDSLVSYLETALRHVFGLFVEPGSFLSVAPLVAAGILGAVTLAVQMHRRGKRVSVARVFRRLFPRRLFLHPSAKNDYAILVINEGFLFSVTVFGLVGAAQTSNLVLALAGQSPPDNARGYAGPAEVAAFSLFILLVWDFCATFAHYLKHRVPILWELHKVHHSAEVLTPITAYRRHPLEELVSKTLVSFGIGLATALWVLAFGAPGSAYQIFGMYAGIYLWRLLGYNLRHSHVWLDYGPFWSRVFISPAQHQIHHSNDPRHYDSNFGHIFAIWDMMLGSLYVPQGREAIEFGIDPAEMDVYRTLRGLYFAPLKAIAIRLVPALEAGRPARAKQR